MVDNVLLNPASASGAVMATDEIGNVHFQIVKISFGALDTQTAVTSAAPFPVGDGGGSLTVDGTVGVTSTSASPLVVTDAGNFNINSTSAAPLIITDAGNLNIAGTVTVDGSGVTQPVSDAGGSLTVDGTVTANAGTGSFAVSSTSASAVVVTDAGNFNIAGTVTVDGSGVTQPVSDAGGSLTIDNAALSQTGGGVEASALRVTVASDSTGVLSVDDNGGSLTVDGTVGVTSTSAAPIITTLVDTSGGSVMDNSNDALRVNIVAGAAAGGTSNTDSSVFTSAAGAGTPAMGYASLGVVTSGDVGVLGMNVNRQLFVSIQEDAVGIGGGIQHQIDAVASADATGTLALATRDDLLTTATPADGDYTQLKTTQFGALWTCDHSLIDSNNSTTATLGIGAAFTGTGVDVSQFAVVTITLFADQDSATDGMTFQFSTDNTNWDDVYSFTMTANEARRFQFPATAQFFRIVYTNGGTGQGAFRVQTILHPTYVGTSIHRIADAVDPDRSTTIVKSAIIAQAAGSGDFNTVNATGGGNLQVSIEEFDAGASLPAGSNVIGEVTVSSTSASAVIVSDDGNFTLAANSGVDIGDVTVNNVSASPVLAHLLTSAGLSVATNGGVEANALRVTMASDSTGVLSVDDNGSTLSIDDGGGSITVDGTVTADLGANNDVQGTGAHDAAVTGNPFTMAGRSAQTLPTAVADADVVRLMADDQGRVVTVGTPRDLKIRRSVLLASASTTTLATAGGAGVFLDLHSITMSNDTAAQRQVILRDTSAGTPVLRMMLDSSAGGAQLNYSEPVPQETANTAWTVELDSNVSAVSIMAVFSQRS